MKSIAWRSVFFILLALLTFGALQIGAENEVLRGWISDEGCARGRAHDGVYTGTNPDCAKKCIAEGRRMIFVDPAHKRLLVVANQNMAKQNIGDYVEVSGEVDKEAKTLEIATLKLLEKGRAMCDVPKKSK